MSFIHCFSSYVPELVVPNSDLAERLSCTADNIEAMSGIRQRRFAAADETVESMAAAAARGCLTGDIGMVIVASGSAERRFPGPAAPVASALGLAPVAALDIPVASAGSLFGLAVAHRMAGTSGDVLLIASEVMSRVAFGDPPEKGTAMLFGDGAAACVVSPSEGAIEIVDCAIHSDGAYAMDLRLDQTGAIQMNGRSVIMQASRKMPASINEVLERNGLAASDVGVFLMHQANQHLIERVARSLQVDPSCFYSNIERYGNTSSASMLLAAAEWWESDRPKPGTLIVFSAFGAGYHWGAILARVVL